MSAPIAATPAATATCPAGARMALLLAEAQLSQDVAEALVLRFDVRAVFVAREPEVLPVVLLERLLPLLALRSLLDRLHQLVALRLGDAGSGPHAAPVGELDIDALLLERRDALHRLGRRDRKRAHL